MFMMLSSQIMVMLCLLSKMEKFIFAQQKMVISLYGRDLHALVAKLELSPIKFNSLGMNGVWKK